MFVYQKNFINNIESTIDLKTFHKVLEIGCGTGEILQYLKSKNIAEIVGIDPAPECLNLNSNKIRIIKGFASSIPYGDKYFDCVVSVATFEHILDLEDSLLEICRVLKDEGVLIARFAPIWTSINGHHYKIESNIESPIPPWGHLYLTENEMWNYLRKKGVSIFESNNIIEDIYFSSKINRFAFSDYIKIFNSICQKRNINITYSKIIKKACVDILQKIYLEKLSMFDFNELLVSGFVLIIKKF